MCGRVGETALEQLLVKSEDLEEASTDDIAQRRDAHTRHDFAQATLDDMNIALLGLLGRDMLQLTLTGQGAHAG